MAKFNALHVQAIVLALALAPATVAAQGMEVRRPYRGLFGSDPNDKTASGFSLEALGAYDDNVYAVGNENTNPNTRPQTSGFFTGLAASLTLQRAGDKVSAGVWGTSDFRYYESDDFTAFAHHVTGFTRYRLAQRTTVGVSGGLAYAPLYTPILMMAPIGDSLAVEGFENLGNPPVGERWSGDYSIVKRPSVGYEGTFDISQALTSRASIGGHYAARYLDYVDEDSTQRFDSVGGDASYRLTRYSTFRAGYTLNTYRLENDGPLRRYHDFQLGIDYNRPLSLSGRRTKLTVTPGFALLDQNGELQLHATGTVALDHEMGRTWTAKALYNRGTRFVEGRNNYLLANIAQAGMQGLWGRRVQLSIEGQYLLSDHEENEPQYRSIAGTARVSYALSRRLSAYAQYIYYNYRFSDPVLLANGENQRTNRQGIRVGVTLWTPILK